MSFWIEVRCSKRTSPGCMSEISEAPMRLVTANLKEAKETLAQMKMEALHAGWVVSDGDFICPKCKEPRHDR